MELYSDPRLQHLLFDPIYISNNLPVVPAIGFALCYKLAMENPGQAARNCNSVALCALGKHDLNSAEITHSFNFQVFTFIKVTGVLDLVEVHDW